MEFADIERYKVDQLFLLVGTNPLPNYVAAKLLVRDPQTATIFLIHSADTTSARDSLERELKREGYAQIISVLVEEANPANIRNQITTYAKSLQGLVGINYTGGTKAMAVHAYLALATLTTLRVQYSYLDARTLTMQIEGHGIRTTDTVPVGTHISLPVDQLLKLHSREITLDRSLFWPHVAQALADVHRNEQHADNWHAWVARSFFQEPAWPQAQSNEAWRAWVREQFIEREYRRRTWVKKKDHDATPLELPEEFSAVRAALHAEAGQTPLNSLGDLRTLGGFKDLERLGKWLEGGWMEVYVMQQIQVLAKQDALHLGDVARNIIAKIKLKSRSQLDKAEELQQEIEIDVAFTCGYQLFVLSCSTSKEKGLGKSKLLEAAIRAEQIGGGEVRLALVSCSVKPREIEKEIADVLGRRVRVFGRNHLHDLGNEVANWITDASRSQE